jgi:hypothetical protein
VDTLEYRRQVVRYIDFNPVLAGLVPTPSLYPHGSARWYAEDHGPPWLERSWVESCVTSVADAVSYDGADYPRCFGSPLGADLIKVVERRLQGRAPVADPLDDLLGASPERVLDWMRRKARIADGTSIDLPVCGAESVCRGVREARATRPRWSLPLSRKTSDAWLIMEVALLRDLCGSTWVEIGARMGLSEEGAARCYKRHARALEEEPEYAQCATGLASTAIARCYGARQSVGTEPGSPPDYSAEKAIERRTLPAAE